MNKTITRLIQEYVKSYPREKATHALWETPLVAFARADDSRFLDLKQQVAPSHLLPLDLLPTARSVICYFLPFNRDITRSNGEGDEFCSDPWAFAYLETNQLIQDLNDHLKTRLGMMGHESAVTPATHNFNPETLLSNWSHRHIAVIAGLGTLGLNRMLITEKGCGGRLGSLVTSLVFTPSKSCADPACLYYYDQTCKKCLKSCPGQALEEESFDRFRCYDHLLKNAELHREKGWVDACGKCLTRLPCSFTDPGKKARQKRCTRDMS
ncbi:MAG: epoxyqueuosine reductase [Syntrophomonas sp.]